MIAEIKFYDHLFDLVHKKRKIFIDDINAIKPNTKEMDKIIKFLFSNGYVMIRGVFVYGGMND